MNLPILSAFHLIKAGNNVHFKRYARMKALMKRTILEYHLKIKVTNILVKNTVFLLHNRTLEFPFQ